MADCGRWDGLSNSSSLATAAGPGIVLDIVLGPEELRGLLSHFPMVHARQATVMSNELLRAQSPLTMEGAHFSTLGAVSGDPVRLPRFHGIHDRRGIVSELP